MAGISLGDMNVNVGANISGLQSGFGMATKIVSGFSSGVAGGLAPTGIALAAVGAGAVVLGAKVVSMAGNFQQSVTKLYTTAGEAKANLQMVGDGVLGMSTQVGTGAQKLIDAMYWVESAGFHGAAGLQILKIAAMGAKAENANVTDVVKTLTSALNAYSGQGLTAAGTMNTLIAATAAGKMTLNDLANAVSNVLPATAKFHISLIDTTAAIATMTMQGDSASSAATHLRQMILAFEAPSKIGAAAMKSVGLSSKELADEMKISLPGAVQMVTDAVGKKFPEGSDKYNQAIKNIAGGSKQMMAYLELSGSHMKAFTDNVASVTSAVKAGGNSIMGWSDVQGNFNFKMAQAGAALEVVGIKIGMALLPGLSKMLDSIIPLIVQLSDWETKTHGVENALGALGNGIQNVVTVGAGIVSFFQHNQVAMAGLQGALVAVGAIATMVFVEWAVTAGIAALATLALAWPILLAGAVVAVVVGGIILAVQHWGDITKWLSGVWGAFSGWFMGVLGTIGAFFTGVWSAMSSLFVGVWNGIVSFAKGAVVNLLNTWNGLKAGAQAAWGATGAAIHTAVSAVVTWVGNAWHTAVSTVVGWFSWLYDHNYYWKLAVDGIKIVVTDITTWVPRAWKAATSYVTDRWNELKNTASSVWNAITSTIRAVVSPVVDWVKNAWSTSSKYVGDRWHELQNTAGSVWSAISSTVHDKVSSAVNGIKSGWNQASSATSSTMTEIGNKVTQAWQFISGVFGSAWNRYIAPPLNSLQSSISGFFGNLGHVFSDFGSHLMQMLASGIGAAGGAVGSAIHDAIAGGLSALGFHGIPGFAGGVQNFGGGLAWVGEQGPELMYVPQGASIYPQGQGMLPSGGSGSSYSSGGNGNVQHISFLVDGMTLATIVNKNTYQHVSLKLGPNGRAA